MLQALQFRHLITFIIVCYCFSWAGTTGKLVGTIIDQETGNPLPGANIVILDTYWGASTDLDGNFLILNLPPGYYDLEISILGYKTVLKKGVQISVDLHCNIYKLKQYQPQQVSRWVLLLRFLFFVLHQL